MSEIEKFRFRSKNGILKFLDTFNKNSNSKGILTSITTILFIGNMGLLDYKKPISKSNFKKIITTLIVLSNIFHLINSELSLLRIDSIFDELNNKKTFISKMYLIFNIYEIGYLPYELSIILIYLYLKKNFKNVLSLILIFRSVPFYLLLLLKKTDLSKNDILNDIFEFFHSLCGIFIPIYLRFKN